MFKQKNRLKKDADIKRVVKSGRGVFDPYCGLKYLQNGLDESRFTVVVGLKVNKKAVDRNRIRRQYREIIRLRLDQMKKGYDVVFLTSKQALDIDYQEKEERLVKVLKKSGLI